MGIAAVSYWSATEDSCTRFVSCDVESDMLHAVKRFAKEVGATEAIMSHAAQSRNLQLSESS